MRHDAVLGASEAALAVERICRGEHHAVGTVGRLETFPGAVNIVPGEARLSLDLRGELDETRDRVWESIGKELDVIAAAAGRGGGPRSSTAHPPCSARRQPQDVIRAGIVATLPAGADDPATIYSRAGHDGMALGALTDIGMVFLRNPDGISHHPAESVSSQDVAAGIRALGAAVTHLAAEPAP